MTIFLLDKVKTTNDICYCCESKNVKQKQKSTCVGGRSNWKTVFYFVPTLFCKDCGINIPQKEESIVRAKAVKIASS